MDNNTKKKNPFTLQWYIQGKTERQVAINNAKYYAWEAKHNNFKRN